MARELHPGKRNSLDALCDRYGVSNAHRKLHGALLDAELLADVYLSMTRGQDSLEIALRLGGSVEADAAPRGSWPPRGLVVVAADAREQAAHDALLEAMEKDAGTAPVWAERGSNRPPRHAVV